MVGQILTIDSSIYRNEDKVIETTKINLFGIPIMCRIKSTEEQEVIDRFKSNKQKKLKPIKGFSNETSN